jgi:hypothetical protein
MTLVSAFCFSMVSLGVVGQNGEFFLFDSTENNGRHHLQLLVK